MIKYRFANQKNFILKVIKVMDFIGYKILSSKKNNLKIDINTHNSLSIVQLGHIGDLLLTIPFIMKLKATTALKIQLCVNPVNYELAKLIPEIDSVVVINHNMFNRNSKVSFFKMIHDFKKIQSDIIFELRGDIRLIPFIKFFSKYQQLVGFDVGGGGFLLDIVMKYPFEEHITKTYDTFLENSNIVENVFYESKLFLNIVKERKKNDNNIVIAIGAGAQSRDWADENFISLIINLEQRGFFVSIVGKVSSERLKKYKNLEKTQNYLNKTTLIEAFKIISECNLFIGLESGLTHAASLLSVKILAIYSDATDENIWKPIDVNGNVNILKHYVKCGKCGLLKCENNICMSEITVQMVIDQVLILQG